MRHVGVTELDGRGGTPRHAAAGGLAGAPSHNHTSAEAGKPSPVGLGERGAGDAPGTEGGNCRKVLVVGGAEFPGSGGGAFPDYGGLAKPAEGELQQVFPALPSVMGLGEEIFPGLRSGAGRGESKRGGADPTCLPSFPLYPPPPRTTCRTSTGRRSTC